MRLALPMTSSTSIGIFPLLLGMRNSHPNHKQNSMDFVLSVFANDLLRLKTLECREGLYVHFIVGHFPSFIYLLFFLYWALVERST